MKGVSPIKVDNVDLDFLQVRTAQLYIIAAYQQAEDFLESFRDEYPLSQEWAYDQDDDLLKRILKNVSPSYSVLIPIQEKRYGKKKLGL